MYFLLSSDGRTTCRRRRLHLNGNVNVVPSADLDEFNIHADNRLGIARPRGTCCAIRKGLRFPLSLRGARILNRTTLGGKIFNISSSMILPSNIAAVLHQRKLVHRRRSITYVRNIGIFWRLDAVFFSVQIISRDFRTPLEALGRFYTDQQANYQRADQMQVATVFNATNFIRRWRAARTT